MQSRMAMVLLFAMLVHADDIPMDAPADAPADTPADAPVDPPVEVAPVDAPEDIVIDQVWCQPGSADCTAFGDSRATCVEDANGLGKCECGDGFENPVTGNQTAHVCLPPNVTTVVIRTTQMWRDALCASYTPAFESELRAILEAVTSGSISADLLPKCGSLTVFGTVDNVPVESLPLDLKAAVQAALDSGNYPAVGAIGAPDSALATTSTGNCAVDYATATGVDTTGTCNAIECMKGYHVARATGEPTSQWICVRIPVDDDDDGLPSGAIVGVAIGCVFLAAILAGITVACRRKARTPSGNQLDETHEMQDRV